MAANHKDSAVTKAPPGIPQFVREHAPIFHLYTSERYGPSSISAFLSHTRPQIDFKDTATPEPAPGLARLDKLNYLGVKKNGANVYLTSFDDVSQDPSPLWLRGIETGSDGEKRDDETGVIIIAEKDEGVVDVFYFCFFAFNWGGIVLDKQLGNHVGDWEHTMIRFVNGKPKEVWLSQHANGEAYAFKALKKDKSGKRPVLYIANGSHAIYAKKGAIDHTIPNFNSNIPFLLVDHCDKGQRYDPLETSYFYNYIRSPNDSPSEDSPVEVTGTFEPVDRTTLLPGWLYFAGHWGDQEYPADDPRQKGKDFLGFRKYGDGPTGPAFKQLARKDVWPANSYAAGQKIRTSLDGSTGIRDRLARWGLKCSGGQNPEGKVMGKPKRVDVSGRVVGKA